MSTNLVMINGSDFDVSDSFMPVLMKWIEYATKIPEVGTQRVSVMGQMMDAMIQERYGPDAEWERAEVTNYDDSSVYTDVTLRSREKGASGHIVPA